MSSGNNRIDFFVDANFTKETDFKYCPEFFPKITVIEFPFFFIAGRSQIIPGTFDIFAKGIEIIDPIIQSLFQGLYYL